MSLDCVLGRDYQDLKIFLRMIFIFPEKRNFSTGSDEVINISVLERKKFWLKTPSGTAN